MGRRRRRRIRPRWEDLLLARLDQERREMVEAVLQQDWTFAELCDASGLSAGELRRLIRAHQRLEKERRRETQAGVEGP